MPKRSAAFVEDFAHHQVIGALIDRVAAELGVEVRLDWRNARRGHGQVVRELKEYLRHLGRQGNLPDIVVVGTDANCKGLMERHRQMPVDESPVPTVLAIPDPHIERWLLLDGAAFKVALGHGCPAPDQKCARDRYKEVLIRAIFNAGVTPSLGGIEDALPLLAFTLEKLHGQCAAGGALTIAAYDALFPPVEVRTAAGRRSEYRGVSAAIKHVADQVLAATGYRDLPPESPRLHDLRRAFYRLAQVGEGGQFTRRSARRRDMPASCDDILQRLVKQRLLVASSEDGEETLSVAHEALFRVWDTLRAWLELDRTALGLRGQIEAAAREWDGAGRRESRRWHDERIMDAVGAIGPSGVALDDVAEPDQVRAFLGPTERDVLETLPFCTTAAASPYGEAWRLPLSHTARASVGVRLALLGDPRYGDGREGTGLRPDGLPDIAWCPVDTVDAGETTIEIRANPLDPRSPVADTLTRAVAPFWIARYPVTLAQFQAFLDACYVTGRWRSTFLAETKDWPAAEPRARYANQPMDMVSWYDATAFCQCRTPDVSIPRLCFS